MLKSLALVLANILIGASGQLMLKAGMTQVGRIGGRAAFASCGDVGANLHYALHTPGVASLRRSYDPVAGCNISPRSKSSLSPAGISLCPQSFASTVALGREYPVGAMGRYPCNLHRCGNRQPDRR